MADESRGYYGVQFHPEVRHTAQGRALLERFILQIAGARPDWVMRDHVAKAVARIREQVGDEDVILGLSGGVDSSVAAALIDRAIGAQLTCVFGDHGLLRLNVARGVMDMFVGRPHARVLHVDASAAFMTALAGVADPEAKRKMSARCATRRSRRPERLSQPVRPSADAVGSLFVLRVVGHLPARKARRRPSPT